MVKYLMKAGLVLALYCGAVYADVLRDPTMPPTGLGFAGLEASQLPSGPVLQSVILGTTGKFAMISGQTVMLGKKYEDYVLVQLKADEARLRAKDGTSLLLKMDFQVEKKQLDISKEYHVTR
jgi:hypothetical protein